MKILVADSRRLTLVKLPSLAITLELEPVAHLRVVESDVATELLASHKCSQKDERKKQSHVANLLSAVAMSRLRVQNFITEWEEILTS